jgi:hypothetical protein
MRHDRSPPRGPIPVLVLLAAILVAAAASSRAQGPPEGTATLVRSGPALGLIADPGDEIAKGVVGERPFFVRLTAEWAAIERERGAYDWSTIESAVRRLDDAGHRPVLCLTGSNPLYLPEGGPPSPFVEESVRAWLAFVRSAVLSLGSGVAVFEIWDRPDLPGTEFDPEIYAFVLKNSALAVKAEADALGVDVVVGQGSVRFDNLEWQRAVWSSDTAAYIDVVPVRFDKGSAPEDVAGALREWQTEIVERPPASAIWAHFEAGDTAAAGAVTALGGSAVVALLSPASEGNERLRQIAWTLGVHGGLVDNYVPAPLGKLTIRDRAGAAITGARVLGRFFREDDFSTLVVYDVSATTLGPQDGAQLILGTGNVRDPQVFDPVTGKRARTASTKLPADPGRSLRLPFKPYPSIVTFRKTVGKIPGLDVPAEDVEVARERGLTAEEIIARYQEVQKVQDDNLESWIARGRVDYHFKLAQGGASLDLSIESNYYWKRGGELEWEETDYYLNGNLLRWKSIPEFPLIQPEKVITLPLDLTLDKTYRYRLEGEDRIGGRAAYVLSFRPTEEETGRSLYQGRLWIDRETFVRLRTSMVQTNLEAPVLSNEERDDFSPIEGPDGRDYWVITKVDGQQLWTAAGRNFVVQRDVVFDNWEINLPEEEFEARRTRAYASDNRMLRETGQGFRYLEREEDGTRTVKWDVDTDQLFAAFGAFKDNSIETVVPLAGVNYFNYDLWGKNVQTNLFFAGVFGFFNFTKPDLIGKRIDGAVEGALSALKGADRVFLGDDEVVEERIRTLSQSVSARLGVPVGQFWKFSFIGNTTYTSYSEDDEARDALAEAGLVFVLPQDHWVLTGRTQVEFNRRGYTVTASGSWSSRSDWKPWGLFDPSTGEFVDPEFDPSQESFSRWRLTAFKEWYLPRFQKVRAEANYMDGDNLDRFSRYNFSFFGVDRLNGFSGTGVRFDEGVTARAGYAFNLLEAIQFNVTVDTARVIDRTSLAGAQRFSGIGLSGNFVGPWKTIFQIGYGRALQSDIKDLEDSQEFLLVILKLFK